MTRGRRPLPPHLRLIEGTHRDDRHGPAPATSSKPPFGKPEMPRKFKGKAALAWQKFIKPADWLDASREPAAIAFCELWAEFQAAPSRFQSAKHGQMRAYMSELGLTDERRRTVEATAPKDEFFDQ